MSAVPPPTSLDESERERALERFHILKPFLEDGVPLPRISAESGIPLRTLRRWVSRYRSGHLAGLARRPRADRGHHKLPAELERFIEGLALQKPRRSAAAIHRQVVVVAEQQGWPQPGYDQVYAVIRELDPGLVSLAHDGTKGYQRAFDLIHRREASRPNEIWQADHTQLDIRLLDEGGQSARPWLTVVLDDYSRAVPGYNITYSAPSSIGTALALHQAIWRKGDPKWQVCGIPDSFYTDHGPDFTSRHMEQVAVDIGMRLVYSEPGQPRGRGKIERFFGTVSQMLLSDLPGYAPEGSCEVPPVLTLPELDTRFRGWLLDEYHERKHGETGQAPSDRWESAGFLPRLPDSREQLDVLLLTVPRPRRVHPDGIRFEGYRYIDTTLAAFVGEDVTIRYDPRDLGEIRVFHREQFVCRAVCPELSGEVIGLKEITGARNKRRRELRTELRDRKATVEELLALRRHELPTGETSDPQPSEPRKPKLKRYIHE